MSVFPAQGDTVFSVSSQLNRHGTSLAEKGKNGQQRPSSSCSQLSLSSGTLLPREVSVNCNHMMIFETRDPDEPVKPVAMARLKGKQVGSACRFKFLQLNQ